MFCPGCGSEQHGQYCRSCGTDLRIVRTALDKSDATIASINSARDEISRAVADKIREVKSAKELSRVVEDVLPGIEKFLETPEEKQNRRIRAGMILSAIGLGAGLAFATLGFGLGVVALLFVAGLGVTTLLIGLGLLFNGRYFTIPKKPGLDKLPEPTVQAKLEYIPNPMRSAGAVEQIFPASVSEHTTHQLPDTKTEESS
jgi:hypothetical protein